jgi:hypothetical protein
LASPLLPEGARTCRRSARGWRANCPRGIAWAALLATDSPLTAWAAATPGKLPSPSEGTRRGTLAPPRSQGRFVMDLWAWCIRTSRNDVGLSPVSVVGPCEQVRPPYTPRVDGVDRNVGHRDCPGRRAAQCFSTTRSLAHRARPDCDPSRSVLAWPLRQRAVAGRRWLRTFPRRKVRARISGRARPRPGRIKSSFCTKVDCTVCDSVNNTCGSH